MSSKTRVLIVHNIMAPYRFPLFRALANQPEIDLTVWFMSASARNRRWRLEDRALGFRYVVLPRVEVNLQSDDLLTYILNYTFPWRFIREHFDVLIAAGWLDFAPHAGLVLSKLLRRKFILWSESTAYEPSLLRTVTRPIVRAIVHGSDACIAVGTRSKDYLKSLGAAPNDIFVSYSTVDVDLFRTVSYWAQQHKEELKASLGIQHRQVVLYSGQFIERKGLNHLLQSWQLVKQNYPNVALVLLGYGPLKSALEAMTLSLDLTDVHFLGHLDVEEIPKIYAVADILVLPSLKETWGLVVNEAMASGLPVVVTDRVGCSVDLVREGENGFIVPAGDARTLADRIGRLVGDDELRARLSDGSGRFIQRFTPHAAALAFAAAVRHAVAEPSMRAPA
jgi:glycosyltransferase involved in cell wall biosynthesis